MQPSLIEASLWVHTGIPECFLGTLFDERREEWDAAVEALLWTIPNVSETDCYGEYSVKLTYRYGEGFESVEKCLESVKAVVDTWVPPFTYKEGDC